MQDKSANSRTQDRTAPLRARLHWYRLSPAEFLVLTAMCEHCSDGSTIWASVPRIAAYSKLSERTVQYVIRGLRGRGILSQLAPGKAAKRRPATYRINEAALQEDPAMAPYRSRQDQLPGIRRPPVTGEPIADLVQPLHQSGAKNVETLVQPLHQSGATAAPDSKAFDSRALDPRARGFENQPALSLDQEGKTESDLEWAKRFTRR